MIASSIEEAKFARRLTTHSKVASELAMLNEQCLFELVENALPLGHGTGGATALLNINGTDVFIKKIRLTDIERQVENSQSTKNVFELPLYYQYGIGSAGFGVWRELATHVLSTNWVLSGECLNFPLMYHWRVLAKPQAEAPTVEQLTELARDVAWWGGSPIIHARLLANLHASAEIVVFLEYFPQNLHEWLRQKLHAGGEAAESSCARVAHKLKTITTFMNAHGLLHFDAHFNNILTDGEDLYFSDFGLAIFNQFELSKVEQDFFNKNYHYDQCYTMAYFVEWLLTELFGIENWAIGNPNALLHDYAAGQGTPLLPVIETIIKRYAPIAVVMNEFFINLKKSSATIYPTDKLARLQAEL